MVFHIVLCDLSIIKGTIVDNTTKVVGKTYKTLLKRRWIDYLLVRWRLCPH